MTLEDYEIKARCKEALEMYPTCMFFIRQSYDNRILMYVPRLSGDGNQLEDVDLVQIDLEKNPLRPEKPTSKLEKLFRMVIEYKKPKRYQMYIRVMPERTIDALLKDGHVITKTHIGGTKCSVKWVFIRMTWMKPLPPNIHSIDVDGHGPDGKMVTERLEHPPTASECLQILNEDVIYKS